VLTKIAISFIVESTIITIFMTVPDELMLDITQVDHGICGLQRITSKGEEE